MMMTDGADTALMSRNSSDDQGSNGGNKPPQNPWQKNRGPEQGPPDLDQLLKDFQQKIKRMLGGSGDKGQGSSKPPTKGPTGRNEPPLNIRATTQLLGLGVFLAIAGYLVSGFYLVQPAERAVITRFGRYVRTELPGLHWLPPFIEDKATVNVERRETTKHNGAMLTEDENIVYVDIAVQYRIKDAKDYLFNVVNPIRTLSEATESALRQVIGQSKLDDVLTSGRASVASAIKKQLIETIDGYDAGLEVFDVSMQPAKAPEEVRAAFDDVIKAREEHESLVYGAQAYANDILPKARGQVQRLLQDAEGYREEMRLGAEGATQRFNLILPAYQKSPEVTKKRLYLEALEDVFSKSNKVIVDTQSNGSPLIYLPIDKLLSDKPEEASLPNYPDATQKSTPSDTVPLRSNNATANSYAREASPKITTIRRYIRDNGERS
ncbi:MAG: HflK protein [Pseudomonadota bacterium]|jgi:membrane protease subunit HflK